MKKEVVSAEHFAIYFSPHSAHAIVFEGKTYPTVEHLYQCMKFKDSDEVQLEIRRQLSPILAWEVSQRNKKKQHTWFRHEGYKLRVMKSLLRMKVAQHADVKKALLASKEKEIVKHITTYPPGDGFWDDGESGEGFNNMGKLWMEVREEILTMGIK